MGKIIFPNFPPLFALSNFERSLNKEFSIMQVLTTYNQTEFQNMIFDSVKNAVQSEIFNLSTNVLPPPKEFLTRQETADLLSISLVTLDNYVKAGYINAFRLGFKVRFRYNDVSNALTKIQMGG